MNCMLQQDSQMLRMKRQILQRQIRQVRNTMDKPNRALCKQAMLEGQNACGGEDLLTECKKVVQEINDTKCDRGCAKYIQKAKEENLK